MIGAIIGDIVGSIYEFNNTFDYDFPLFSEDSTFTDDTICTIAVADALVKGISYKDSLLNWCRKYPSPMGGYGGSFNEWLNSYNPTPYDSFGNGAAMRVSPVAWASETLDDVLKEAKETALPTHNHPEGIKGAQAVAHVIFAERFSNDNDTLLADGNVYYPDFEEDYFRTGKFDVTCMGTVPLAFQIVLKSKSFEDAIRRAISKGGDSDTLGAVVGSIAEARFGIPDDIREKALSLLPAEMLEVIDAFSKKFNYNQPPQSH